MEEEPVFDPPHGKALYNITCCETTLTGTLEDGTTVTIRGRLQPEAIPDAIETTLTKYTFAGDFEEDDFVYPVEVRFADNVGCMYEDPKYIPDGIDIINCTQTHINLVDHIGCVTALVRDPAATWLPHQDYVEGRIGHTLYWL